MRVLNRYVVKLNAAAPDVFVPYFDPASAGVNAEVLFLFERPGPATVESGFLSIAIDDPTANATRGILKSIGIDPMEVLFWNVIPG